MSPYYSNLRSDLGNRLLLMPGVAGLIYNSEDELLLQRKFDGSWSLPAGAIEPSETPQEAIKREVLEETGYVVRELQLVDVFGGANFRYTYSNGHEVENVVILFHCICEDKPGKPTDVETVELRYFSKNDFPGLSLPYPLSTLYLEGE